MNLVSGLTFLRPGNSKVDSKCGQSCSRRQWEREPSTRMRQGSATESFEVAKLGEDKESEGADPAAADEVRAAWGGRCQGSPLPDPVDPEKAWSFLTCSILAHTWTNT